MQAHFKNPVLKAKREETDQGNKNSVFHGMWNYTVHVL